MRNRGTIAVAALIGVLYVAAIVGGLMVRRMWFFDWPAEARGKVAWMPPRLRDLPDDAQSALVRRGASIFDETPLYAAKNVTAKMSCASCHAEGGTQPFAAAMVGVPATFPQFNQRAGHVISLEDRIQECVVRSENGRPLDYNGGEMKALVAYINWLSQPRPDAKPFVGRGFVNLPDLTPDPKHGEQVYAAQCAGCHGQNGEGKPFVYPPLWGPDSFNDGAGMNGVRRMAAFVQHNMPQNRMGILSPQDAYDVAAFVHAQPRPAFNEAYKKY